MAIREVLTGQLPPKPLNMGSSWSGQEEFEVWKTCQVVPCHRLRPACGPLAARIGRQPALPAGADYDTPTGIVSRGRG